MKVWQAVKNDERCSRSVRCWGEVWFKWWQSSLICFCEQWNNAQWSNNGTMPPPSPLPFGQSRYTRDSLLLAAATLRAFNYYIKGYKGSGTPCWNKIIISLISSLPSSGISLVRYYQPPKTFLDALSISSDNFSRDPSSAEHRRVNFVGDLSQITERTSIRLLYWMISLSAPCLKPSPLRMLHVVLVYFCTSRFQFGDTVGFTSYTIIHV